VYNYREIRRELEARGCTFRGGSDTEVIVNAIRTWGMADAIRRFIGMFAFAVWSVPEQRLYLVRDRVGIKPLFYWSDTQRVLFGSEVRALMAHPAFRKELDPVGIGQFFVSGMTLGENTALRGVRRVLPGHIVSISANGEFRDEVYWSLDDVERSTKPRAIDDAADELQSLLDSAVGYRLVADVPVTNFLSGGIDSSLVAATLKRRLGADVLNITVGFDEKAFDESEKAGQVARELAVRHETHRVRIEDAEHGLSEFVEIFDEPFGDTSGIPTWMLSRIARTHAKVALSADGGDEQFCGYESYARYARTWERLSMVPVGVRRAASAMGGLVPWRTITGASGTGRRTATLRPQTYARIQKALRIGGVGSSPELIRTMFEKAWSWNEMLPTGRAGGPQLFDRTVLADSAIAAADDALMGSMMRADYQAFLRDDVLTKVDRASMHVSLEARDPMLDHRIAEFAFGLPLDLVYSGGEHKRVLKHLLRREISESVVSSPKRGFSIPLYAWMRGVWKPAVMEHLSDDAVRRVGVLDARVVRQEVERFYKYAGGSAERIWMLLNFQMWAQRWLIS
jgi:asparagine synthase (glutamine-hydrolysing)